MCYVLIVIHNRYPYYFTKKLDYQVQAWNNWPKKKKKFKHEISKHLTNKIYGWCACCCDVWIASALNEWREESMKKEGCWRKSRKVRTMSIASGCGLWPIPMHTSFNNASCTIWKPCWPNSMLILCLLDNTYIWFSFSISTPFTDTPQNIFTHLFLRYLYSTLSSSVLSIPSIINLLYPITCIHFFNWDISRI